MAIICTARHNAKHFNWNDPQKKPIAEMSDLCGALRDGVRLFSQIYDDACDVGFTLINDKSDSEATFYLDEVVYHGRGEDREVGGWRFKPTPETLNQHPKLTGYELCVIND